MSDGLPGWTEPDWPAPPGVQALSTRRTGGVSAAPFGSLNLGSHVGDSAVAVAENRRRLAAAADLPSEPVWLTQVHGARVLDLDAGLGVADAAGGADASFTRRVGVVCAVLSADCLPILLTSATGDVVAAAHAGWRGLAGGVIEATVAAMRASGVPGAGRLMAWLGPAIGAGRFEVGPEVREAMLAGDEGAAVAFAPNARGRLMADLAWLARRRLEALGVETVHAAGDCTFERAEAYFSHRRDGVGGRQATLIWRRA